MVIDMNTGLPLGNGELTRYTTTVTKKPRDLTVVQIDSACTSYRHDFGLLAESEKENLRMTCREWFEAIRKEFE